VNSSQSTRSFRTESSSLNEDWLRASLLAGFVATFAMTATVTIGYGIANSTGEAGGNTFQRWMYGLSENELTSNVADRFLLIMVANLVCGLVWSVLYARFFQPMFGGAGWRSGAVFSLIPWLLSICVFFPISDAGFFGMNLDAGPLPVIGNLIVHLVFGITLGSMYAIDIETGLDGSVGDRATALAAETGMAIGLAIGGIAGAVGGWLIADQFDRLASQPVIALAGALSGAAIGTLLGSYAGMSEGIYDAKTEASAERAADSVRSLR